VTGTRSLLGTFCGAKLRESIPFAAMVFDFPSWFPFVDEYDTSCCRWSPVESTARLRPPEEGDRRRLLRLTRLDKSRATRQMPQRRLMRAAMPRSA
jgi:hypothetical protein